MHRASNSLWTQNNVLSTRFGPELGNGNDVHEEPKSVAKEGIAHEVAKVVKNGLVHDVAKTVKDGLVHEVAKMLAKDHGEPKVLANVRLLQNRRSHWKVEPSGSLMVSCSAER